MKLVALIVTFNRLEKLKKCWAASAALNFTDIIIVNNASTDNTAEWLASITDSRLKVITLQDNTGGAGGFKVGIQYIDQQVEADFVALYDDDAYPTVDLLENFSSIRSDEYQAYCCRVEDLDGNLCKMNVPYAKFPSTFADTLSYIRAPQRFLPNEHCSQTVASFSFVGLIIDKRVLVNNINSIYPELFIYYDDLYLSKALTDKGIKIRYSPEVVFKHDIPVGVKTISPTWKVYYLVRNLFLARYLSRSLRAYSTPAIMIRVLKYLVLTIKQEQKLSYLHFVFKGITDGISNKSGKKH
ncbi:glycosyltransferase [Rouxiella badensis]|jgi:GT2 family glycosyltransferase|uniref:glycosyltransferase n=1 Tax=Rouxiella badensis TaxID=1646377 RepID=UPI000377315B|nr:glycosyltransferase [Rouxiella badensis]MCC3703379.1 glycosyltransferase [Rouxiella badensis]MCC3718318.1 glycosyltransferase [Rouxiella badensis]MCC3726914.1 glycosyltransferase [Rouxiella badensis]MCC3731802.1 glycosyltransferase [Rouxiella badensis]MCC3738737.1 glycosyltransferase [Rouxiella badensis]